MEFKEKILEVYNTSKKYLALLEITDAVENHSIDNGNEVKEYLDSELLQRQIDLEGCVIRYCSDVMSANYSKFN